MLFAWVSSKCQFKFYSIGVCKLHFMIIDNQDFYLEMFIQYTRYVLISLFDRFLDDVALHHLIDALCKLSSEAMDVAYANKVFYFVCLQYVLHLIVFCRW